MIRAVELGLFLAPLGLYVLWRTTLARGKPGPTPQTLVLLLIALLAMGAGLVWSSFAERHPGNTRYVPAQLQDGQIVSGHGV